MPPNISFKPNPLRGSAVSGVRKHMTTYVRLLAIAIAAATCLPAAHASPSSEFCKKLRNFVESVQPDENKDFILITSWGENFKDMPELALAAKRCEHGGYEPAKKLCDYLLEHTSTEFPGSNVKKAIACLSKKRAFHC